MLLYKSWVLCCGLSSSSACDADSGEAVEGSLSASIKAPMHPCAVLKGGSLQVLNGVVVFEFGMERGVSGCIP